VGEGSSAFLKKSAQKTFDLLRDLALSVINPAGIKSFLLLFFKKKRFLSHQNPRFLNPSTKAPTIP